MISASGRSLSYCSVFRRAAVFQSYVIGLEWGAALYRIGVAHMSPPALMVFL